VIFSCVGLTTVTGAVTEEAPNTNRPVIEPTKFVPVTVTTVPDLPTCGVNVVIVGTWTNVKLVAETPEPTSDTVTVIGPVLASDGTTTPLIGLPAVMVAGFGTVTGCVLPLNVTVVV